MRKNFTRLGVQGVASSSQEGLDCRALTLLLSCAVHANDEVPGKMSSEWTTRYGSIVLDPLTSSYDAQDGYKEVTNM